MPSWAHRCGVARQPGDPADRADQPQIGVSNDAGTAGLLDERDRTSTTSRS